MDKSKYGVHQDHCCKKHGCKYGDNDCPVEDGTVIQTYICQYGDEMNDSCFNEEVIKELHEAVDSPNWDLKPKCSCGERSNSWMQLYRHQADTLREQLRLS